MANRIYLKTIKHPNTFSIAQGTTLLSQEITSINESIGLILKTAKGELFGDPTFGSTLYANLYDYVNANFMSGIQDIIVEDINRLESRVTVNRDDVVISVEDKTVIIDITYNLKYTDLNATYSYIVKIQDTDNLEV